MNEDQRQSSPPPPDSECSTETLRPEPGAESPRPGDRESHTDPPVRSDVLRALFRRPQYNRCDGLDDYDFDFQGFQLPPEAVRAARQNLSGDAVSAGNEPAAETAGQTGFGPEREPTATAETPASQQLRREPTDDRDHPEDGRKPAFPAVNTARCAYDRRGREGCRRCLDLCPTQAVTPLDGRLQIETDRCRGCGICATACPLGAIPYRQSTPQELLVMLRLEIDAAVDAGVLSPAIAFLDRNTAQSLRTRFESFAPELIAVEVHDVASVGLEIWLNALVYGAGSVLQAVGPATPAETVQELSAQQATADLLVKGLGYETTRIEIVGPGIGSLPRPLPNRLLPIETAVTVFHPFTDKRRLIHQALEILHRHSPHPGKAVDLPVGSPFGTVILNRDICTLCSACAEICPTGALQAGGGQPQLQFTESACVQCGLCRRVCPESALGLFPRYVYDRRQSDESRILHQEEPRRCIRCGSPFAAPGAIRKLEAVLAGHWMYADASSRQRLRMCHACRLADLLGYESGR